MKVLLVEDSMFLKVVTEQASTRAGYEVISATDRGPRNVLAWVCQGDNFAIFLHGRVKIELPTFPELHGSCSDKGFGD